MLDFLFRRLTAEPKRGAALFDSVVRIARQPRWYADCAIPDTLDGRFAVLATVTALLLVRLEADSEVGDVVSVALTERFIEAMEAEHRELGQGDPTLGKTVRKLVGALARRTEQWRAATREPARWAGVVRDGLYRDEPAPSALTVAVAATEELWTMLQGLAVGRIEQGDLP
jgi:cytochrome b pre-mRNA-processing protein 3